MLQLQANDVGNPDLSERLQEASSRVNAVGRAYERLAYNADYENIDLVDYLREVIGDLKSSVAPCTIHFEAAEKILFAADRAILVALVINELVSNAGKYAYPAGGVIWVRVIQSDKTAVLVTVRDDGVGLPAGFDPATSKRLGSRLVMALARQLGAELTRPAAPLGTTFSLLVPLKAQ
jgi:two-component sensor histidine kinase